MTTTTHKAMTPTGRMLEALQLLASVQHCSLEQARQMLLALSQRDQIRMGVLSSALVEVARGSAAARNPSTGTMVVACALWRRELALLMSGWA